MFSNAIDASEFSSCEWYGHVYTFPGDPEVYAACVDCGAANPAPEPVVLIGVIRAQNVTVANTITGGLSM